MKFSIIFFAMILLWGFLPGTSPVIPVGCGQYEGLLQMPPFIFLLCFLQEAMYKAYCNPTLNQAMLFSHIKWSNWIYGF